MISLPKLHTWVSGWLHQHFMLVDAFTVAENIILGSETTKAGVIDLKKAIAEIKELSARYGLEVDPTAKVADISVGAQQRVEILKTLYRGADLLIFDERNCCTYSGRDCRAIEDYEDLSLRRQIDYFDYA